MDPDLLKLLGGDGSEEPHGKVIEMPVQKIEGDPEAGMSGLAKLGKVLSEQRAPLLLRSDTPGDIASGLAGGITGHLDERLPFGIGDTIKADRAEAEKRNPALMTGADVVGTVASPIGIEAKADTAAARIGAAAATGGMQAAARSVGDAPSDEDLATQAWKALGSGAEGAGAGLVLGSAGEALGKVSNTARRFAVGGTAKNYEDIVKDQGTRSGIDYIANDLGKIPEQQGLTNVLLPQSRAGYATRAAERKADVVGPIINDTLDQAGREVPADVIAGSKDRVLHSLARDAQDLQTAGRPGWRQLDQSINQAGAAPMDTPTDLAMLKRDFEGEAYSPNAVAGSRESRYANAQLAGANATRNELRNVMNSADPVTAARWNQANRDYGDTTLIEKMARKGASKDFAAPLVGGVSGGILGYEAGGHDWKSGLEGAAGGALAGHYGADLTANVARIGERVAGNSATAKLGGILAEKMGGTSKASAQDIADNAHGHLIPEAMQAALRTNKLGPYSDQVARAAMSEQPGALGALYQNLSADPGFSPYKRLLQELTTSEEDR